MSGPIEMADTAAGVQRTLRDNSALAADQAEDQSDHVCPPKPLQVLLYRGSHLLTPCSSALQLVSDS